MSDQTKPLVTLEFSGLDDHQVYRTNDGSELASAAVIKTDVKRILSNATHSANVYLNSLEPATPEETRTYLAEMVSHVEKLRKELQSTLAKLTGCYVRVDVAIHNNDRCEYPLFNPAADVVGAVYGSYNSSRWWKLGDTTHGETTVFGPTLIEEAE